MSSSRPLRADPCLAELDAELGPRRRARVISAALATCGFLLVVLGASAARATPAQDGGHKVTICHATSSDSNPYVEETVDVASILDHNGHGSHTGPIWTADHPAHQSWGDIIPAFDFGPGEQYDGMNQVDGRGFLADHCAIPVGVTTTSTTVEPPTTVEQPTTTTTVERTRTTTADPTTTTVDPTTTTVDPTTTTTVDPTTTTVDPTTTTVDPTTTTVDPTTTTTVDPTTTTVDPTTTTVDPTTTTSSSPSTTQTLAVVAAGDGPTTSTTALAASHGALPSTGGVSGPLLTVGAALLLSAIGTLGLARRARGS